MLLWLVGTAWGRDIVREGPRLQPPEAWFVLRGPVRCEMTVIVGPDGVPLDARSENCAAVLEPALREGALRWRWSRAAETTAEQVEVEVLPPPFTPRARPNDCLVGFEIRGGQPTLLGESGRCEVVPGAVAEVDTSERRTTAWCAVDVVADEQGIQSVEATACTEGYEDATIAALRSWSFSARKPQSWRVLVGYAPAG
jgi:hypothetical protein